MFRDRRWSVPFGPDSHQRVKLATGLLAVALLLGLQSGGCGGGSSGTQDVPPASPTFTTIDVPGAGITAPEGTFAIGINANGAVVGYFFDSNNAIHAFVRDSGGAVTTFDAPGARTQQGLGTEAVEINLSGTIVGFFVDQALTQHSYIRAPDGTITVFDPPGANPGSGAGAINDSGTVAGGYLDPSGAHGFLRASDGTFTTFDILGLLPSQIQIVVPTQINSSGVVAGTYTDSGNVLHGFLRDSGGTITVLDGPGAGTVSGDGTEALDINGNGVIVGVIRNGSANGAPMTHSVMRAADGTYTVFDPPQAGANGSLADGINDSGAIVGSYVDANMVRHGYLRQTDGTFVSFDDPGAAQLGVSITNLDTAPRRINAGGTIAGLYSDAAGTRHGFIRE